MKARIVAAALAACWSLDAFAFDQPEVKYYVQLRGAGKLVDCRVGAAPLGEWAFMPLADGRRVEATASPLDADGKSSLRVKIVSAQGVTEHEFDHDAKLAQSSPRFTRSASGAWPMNGISVLVESLALLQTTRSKPSWREFDPRTNPDLARQRPVEQGGCGMDRVAAADTRD